MVTVSDEPWACRLSGLTKPSPISATADASRNFFMECSWEIKKIAVNW